MDIFRAQEDFEYMRHCLREARVGRGVALHSYVLMSNHIHLLVTAEDDTGVSRFVQSAAVRYVARFNRKYQRTGTLWEGRFFSAVVTTDHYLMACHRYIDENPIRAGLASCAADYPWSSHRHHAYGAEDDLVCAHPSILAPAPPIGLRKDVHVRVSGLGHRSDSHRHPQATRPRRTSCTTRPAARPPDHGAGNRFRRAGLLRRARDSAQRRAGVVALHDGEAGDELGVGIADEHHELA